MTGDTNDMLARLKLVLPARWFSDTTPILDAVLTGLASAWSGLYALLSYVRSQSRIATASGIFLDIASTDYLGDALPRRATEADAAYRARIRSNLLSPRATRASLVQMLTNLTGRVPIIFEPLNATDTGGYNVNLGYNISGGYGSANLPYRFFLRRIARTIRLSAMPAATAQDLAADNQAPMFYADTEEFAGTVSDAEIYAAVAAVLPTSSIAWTQISN